MKSRRPVAVSILLVLYLASCKDSTSPIIEVAVSTAVRISAGASHTCAVDASGTVTCWGRQLWGGLGDGTLCQSFGSGCDPFRATPARINGNLRIRSVA